MAEGKQYAYDGAGVNERGGSGEWKVERRCAVGGQDIGWFRMDCIDGGNP